MLVHSCRTACHLLRAVRQQNLQEQATYDASNGTHQLPATSSATCRPECTGLGSGIRRLLDQALAALAGTGTPAALTAAIGDVHTGAA
jgi:hypothetical protein